jgi:hypothetical protein
MKAQITNFDDFVVCLFRLLKTKVVTKVFSSQVVLEAFMPAQAGLVRELQRTLAALVRLEVVVLVHVSFIVVLFGKTLVT